MVTALLAAFQFLTILPPVIRRPFTAQEMGRSVGFYPLVGLALGGIAWGLALGLGLALPALLTAALVLASGVVLTRALHLDGFMDACDGLLGGFTPEKRLDIMRDSRVGAFGVAGGALLLLTRFAALEPLMTRPWLLLIVPVLGRWAMALALVGFPYARESGLGWDIKNNARWPQALLATAITAAACWLTAQWAGLVALGLAGIATWAAAHFVLARIPGLTGDIYGAICEIGELAALVFFAAGVTLL